MKLSSVIVALVLMFQTACTSQSAAVSTTSPASSNFINSIEEFEYSTFCKKYGCNPFKAYALSEGTNHPYMIDNYPKYNEFFIEIGTRDSSIVFYGITLDPKKITQDELQLLEIFLSSYSPNAVNPQIMEFVIQNLDNDVGQICQSNSIYFGSKQLWVGRIGSAPTVRVADKCE